jgi:hypothetical protein
MKRLALVVASALVSGCVTLTPEAQAVRVTTNADAVRGCKFIGNVRDEGTSVMPDPVHRVEDMMKKKTAALGGNVLMIINMTSAETISGTGEAYRCIPQTISSDDPPPTEIPLKPPSK